MGAFIALRAQITVATPTIEGGYSRNEASARAWSAYPHARSATSSGSTNGPASRLGISSKSPARRCAAACTVGGFRCHLSVQSNSSSMRRRSEAVKRPSESVTKSEVRNGRVSSILEARKIDAMEASWNETLPQDRRER